jgi:hypothetical protein
MAAVMAALVVAVLAQDQELQAKDLMVEQLPIRVAVAVAALDHPHHRLQLILVVMGVLGFVPQLLDNVCFMLAVVVAVVMLRN